MNSWNAIIEGQKRKRFNEIAKAVKECGGNISATARRFGMPVSTLYYQMKKYGYEPKKREKKTERS